MSTFYMALCDLAAARDERKAAAPAVPTDEQEAAIDAALERLIACGETVRWHLEQAFLDDSEEVRGIMVREIVRTILAPEQAAPEMADPLTDLMARAAHMCECYAEFIRTDMPVDIERHPYLPELEEVAEDIRAALRHCAAFDKGDLAECVDERLLDLVKTGRSEEAGIYIVSLYRKRVADRAAWGEASP